MKSTNVNAPSTETLRQVRDMLLDFINTDSVPEELTHFQGYHSFRRVSSYMGRDCIYLIALCRVLIQEHPNTLKILKDYISD